MYKKIFLSLASILILLGACKNKVEVQNFVRPVKVAAVDTLNFINKDFAGVVESYNNSFLTFRVSGTINKLNVVEGSKVKKGEVIAELDPRDFLLELNARKVAYQTSKSQLERNKRLLEKEAVSTQDYEMAEAKYSMSKTEYEYALNQLADAKLVAPFAGFIEKKYVENHQKISAGEQIVKLVDPESLEIKFTIPDSYINVLLSQPHFYVEFEKTKGVWYKAKMKEFIESSTGATGIPVKLAIDDPRFNNKILNISSGFSCKIKLSIPTGNNFLSIPVSAVFEDPKTGKTSVWIYDTVTNTAKAQSVTLGTPIDSDRVYVKDGLKPNDLIIIAGAQNIYSGEKLKILHAE